MPFYLLKAGGIQDSAFNWSVTAVASSSAPEGTAATAWDTGWTTLWSAIGAYVPTTTSLTFTSASTASSSFRQTTRTRTTRNNAGAATGTPLPMYVAPVVTFRSAQATRYGHGRWFLPGFASNALAAAGYVMLPAAQTAIQSGVNGLLTNLRGTLQIVILHRKATLHGPGAFTTDLVVTGDVSNLFHVQKRRQSKITPTRIAVTP
ncbi:MAG TPA: hypothetical protein VF748_14870 [Candidatus Acidoferrum sp.]